MELSGGWEETSGKRKHPEIFFVRKIHEGFCSITMQTLFVVVVVVVAAESSNEDKREPKSL